jgi:hypothetical protein
VIGFFTVGVFVLWYVTEFDYFTAMMLSPWAAPLLVPWLSRKGAQYADRTAADLGYGLLPAGEFQPASISPQSLSSDLDIWRNMVREYAEEMLGQPEHDGSGGSPVDYEIWPFYRDMTAARTAGTIRPYVLGIILDALSLNASIATVTVIDDHVFDNLFRDLVTTNPEGDVVGSLDNNKSVHGFRFDQSTVHRLTNNEPLGQTSAACLSLAWQHHRTLLQVDHESSAG